MKTSEVLQVARYYMHVPEWWSRTKQPCNPEATCAVLAIHAKQHTVSKQDKHNAVRILSKVMTGPRKTENNDYWHVADWNDTHAHPEVLQKFDEAIAISQAEEANA